MAATLQLEYNQIKKLINQLNMEEKKRLAEYLDSLTLRERYDEFIERKNDISLTIEEIQDEVERVRSKRYNERCN